MLVRFGGQGGNFVQSQGQRSAPPPQRPAFQQNRQTTPAQTPVKTTAPGSAPTPRTCYICGDRSHFAHNCPKRNAQTPQHQSGSAPRQNTPQQQNRNVNPTPQSNKGQQNQMRGKVNHVAAESAQEA